MSTEIVPKMEQQIEDSLDELHENVDQLYKVLVQKLIQEEVRNSA